MHICRKWRRIVLASQQALHLRLFCTRGMPVLKNLDFCPSLPIVVKYGGSPADDPPTLSDENNIMAALKESGRVTSVTLTVTSSLLQKLYAIERPFSELEELVLLSRECVPLTLPSVFRSAPRLCCLRSTRVAFKLPSLLQLLYSSRNLVDLQLHEVLNPSDIEVLTYALPGMAQLRSLSLHFLPSAFYVSPSTPVELFDLPALTQLKFHGLSECLAHLLSRIDAPRLGDIEITFRQCDEISFGALCLREFINRTEMHKSHRQAQILSSENAISISLIQPGAPTRIKFQIFCESLYLQLFSMAPIFTRFSAFLLDVEDLHINVTRQSRQENISYTVQWLELLNLFGGVKWLHVVGNLSDIVHGLRLLGKAALPALHCLYIPRLGPRHVPLEEAIVSFMILRRLSGSHIAIEYERSSHMSEVDGAGTKYTQSYCHCSLTRFQ